MDSDEVLRLKQINGLLELFADRRFSEARRLNSQSEFTQPLPAASTPASQSKDESVYAGRIGAEHRQRNGRHAHLFRQPLAKLTSSRSEIAL